MLVTTHTSWLGRAMRRSCIISRVPDLRLRARRFWPCFRTGQRPSNIPSRSSHRYRYPIVPVRSLSPGALIGNAMTDTELMMTMMILSHDTADAGQCPGQLPGQHGAGVPHQHGPWEHVLVRACMLIGEHACMMRSPGLDGARHAYCSD